MDFKGTGALQSTDIEKAELATGKQEFTNSEASTEVNCSHGKEDVLLEESQFISGRYTDAPFCEILIRPVIIFFYPAVLWAFLIYGYGVLYSVSSTPLSLLFIHTISLYLKLNSPTSRHLS